MDSISVMLVDDDPILRHVVRCFLRECWGAEAAVVGTADRGAEAASRARELQPEIVVIDLSLRDLSGLEVLQQLRQALPTADIIALGRMNVAGYRHAAGQAGANEFVLKARVSDDLIPAIRRVVRTRRPRRAALQRNVAGRLVPLMPPSY